MLEFIKKWFDRSGKPLASVRNVERWLERQNIEAARLPQEIVNLIDQSLDDPSLVTAEGLAALQFLDERLQTPLQMLGHQYVSNPRMSRQIQEKIWNDVISISAVMQSAYRRFVQLGHDNPDEALIEKALPIVIARSLRYLAIDAKWHYFRLEPANAKVWARAHQLYRLSEVKHFDSDPLTLYPGVPSGPTTCADEYLKLLLLETINSGNLLPRQIDLIDSWLNKWTQGVTLERQYNPERHLYVVNLTEAEGLSRSGDEMVGDMCRYISMQSILAQISQVIKALEQGESPAKLDLGTESRGPGSLDLLRMLQQQWVLQKDRHYKRSSERRPVRKVVDVIHGVTSLYVATKNFADVQSRGEVQKEYSDYDELVDMKLYGFVSSRTREKQAQQSSYTMTMSHTLLDTESWMVENESDGGYGAVLPTQDNDWVRIGALVGVREQGEKNWAIGVIRRLTKVNADQMYAGIQSLLYQSWPVRLELLNQPRQQQAYGLSLASTPGATTVPELDAFTEKNGLILVSDDKKPSLVMQTADYSTDRVLKLVGREKTITARIKEVKEKGLDWTWANLEIIHVEGN